QKRANPEEAPPSADDEVVDEAATETESEESPSDEEWIDEDATPEDAPEIDWGARALDVIPGGASTGSKRREALYGSESASGPTHFVQAAGCRVTDATGRTYIDCTMALGSVALGYAEPRVRSAVIAAVAAGNVSGLSDVREVEVAERLRDHVPSAERVRFLKSGAEGMSAAVRIARTYTGRDLVLGCGYFGWHDWSSDAAGVPEATQALFHATPFDDVAALEGAAREAGDRLAAIV